MATCAGYSRRSAGFEGHVLWRGAALDRLLAHRHADLVGASVRWLERGAWTPHLEITYSIFGERGSIDMLGVRPIERAVVVAEIKSEFGSVENTIRKLMRRHGWCASGYARTSSAGSLG